MKRPTGRWNGARGDQRRDREKAKAYVESIDKLVNESVGSLKAKINHDVIEELKKEWMG